MSQKPRFPFPRYPRGWFQVAHADEVAPGRVLPVRAFGTDLVLFRTESGELSVLDAFCPHLGAHLGHGGVIKAESIVCPFHSWEFDAKGRCAAVPYAKRMPKKADVAAWPVREVNGLVMVWHDIDGDAPSFEIPEIPEWRDRDTSWTPYLRRTWRLRTHNQEMCENVVDTAHFKYVHGMKIVPEPHRVEAAYPHLRMTTRTVMQTKLGEVEGVLDVDVHGFGFSCSRFTGLVETTVVASVTPVDEELVDVRFSFTVKKTHGDDVARGVGKAFTAEIARQLEEDRPVWENKAYLENAMLCDGDGPIAVYRRWCREFYPAWYREQALAEFRGEREPEKALTLEERRLRAAARRAGAAA